MFCCVEFAYMEHYRVYFAFICYRFYGATVGIFSLEGIRDNTKENTQRMIYMGASVNKLYDDNVARKLCVYDA